MVLWVRPTPTRFPTKILYISLHNTPLYSIPSVLRPWGSKQLSESPMMRRAFLYSFYKGYNISCGTLRLPVTAFILFLGMEMDSVD